MSEQNNEKKPYYFGEITKVAIKEEEIVEVFAYLPVGVKVSIFSPVGAPVMVAPSSPSVVFAPAYGGAIK